MPVSRKKRIAVVNNDTDFLSLMQEILADEGYDVVTCRVGNEAHQFVRAQEPDLVILDLRLDGEADGWEVLELLRLDPKTGQVPVLVCSAASDLISRSEKQLRTHGCEILPKPFDLTELLSVVQRLLRDPSQLS